MARRRGSSLQFRYPKDMPGGLALLVYIEGSVIPRVIPFGIIAAIYAVLLGEFGQVDSDKLFVHPYPYHFLAFMTGFVLVFRINLSYQRFWEARTMAQNMSSKWGDAALQVLAFDEVADPSMAESGARFRQRMLHGFSLMHGVALLNMRGDIELPFESTDIACGNFRRSASLLLSLESASRNPHVSAETNLGRSPYESRYMPFELLGDMSENERAQLLDAKERVHLVMSWMLKEVVARRKAGGVAAEAPVVSRIYQVLSDGLLGYLNAIKLTDTPFPFAYAQLNAVFCVINLTIFPTVVASKVTEPGMRAALSFLGITMMYSINEVARELEDPFTAALGSYSNRLQAAKLQALFNTRLLAFYHSKPLSAVSLV